MSVVTNIILKTLFDENEALEHINNWLKEESFGSKLFKHDSTNCAGTKCLECELYLRVEFFIEVVKNAPWEDSETVQLLVQEQDDLIFTERFHS